MSAVMAVAFDDGANKATCELSLNSSPDSYVSGGENDAQERSVVSIATCRQMGKRNDQKRSGKEMAHLDMSPSSTSFSTFLNEIPASFQENEGGGHKNRTFVEHVARWLSQKLSLAQLLR